MNFIAIGVDPGVSDPPDRGAIGIITPDRASVFDLPVLGEERQLVEIVAPYLSLGLPVYAKVEEQTIWWADIQKHSQWSVLKLIKHMQMCESVLRTLGVKVDLQSTAKWKQSLRLTGKGKQETFDLMMQLFPECQPQLFYKVRKWRQNYNRADALAIARSVVQDVESEAA